MVTNIINQILSSANPQAAFSEVLNKIPNGQNLWQQFQMYGNGDPSKAVANYAAQTGKQNIAQQVLNNLGLGQ